MLRMPSSMASQHRLSLPLASEEGSELQGRRAEKPPFVEFILSREWGREISHGFRANTGKGSFSFDNVMPSPSFSPDPQSTPFFLFLSFFFFFFVRIPPLGLGESRVIMADFFDSLPLFLPLPRYQIRWQGNQANRESTKESLFLFHSRKSMLYVSARVFNTTPRVIFVRF